MSSHDLFEDGFPHGTAEGYDRGYRAGWCPGQVEYGVSCRRAKQMANGDYRYKRLVAEGRTPAEIAAIIDGTATPEPARPLAERSQDRTAATSAQGEPPEGDVPLDGVGIREEMGHPTTSDQEEPVMPEPVIDPAPPAEARPDPLRTEKWTGGMTVAQKTAKLAEIRAWCRAAGYDVPSRGKIPQAALAAYDANQEAVASLAIDRAPDAQTIVLGPAEAGEPITPTEYSEALDQIRERVDAPTPAKPILYPSQPAEPPMAADLAEAIAIAEDERDRARALAARLEQELAKVEAERDQALTGMAFLLRRLDAAARDRRKLESIGFYAPVKQTGRRRIWGRGR